ncbi:MAG: hypothetical protein RMY16_23915 [Nostoc sp. DedQUE12b]|uniref:hypothetical protein n=1 Tax=Nostoc sp. DedQUE12b TaxID=3075398 RepID=UPI002AD31629|nr:hypothetical protein [Nostoc sp. DedQUE12b]MDZ8088580.1 hypothetical protein [Nostoc sp. DedQUE12b]
MAASKSREIALGDCSQTIANVFKLNSAPIQAANWRICCVFSGNLFNWISLGAIAFASYVSYVVLKYQL